jgi:hypothetical protein
MYRVIVLLVFFSCTVFASWHNVTDITGHLLFEPRSGHTAVGFEDKAVIYGGHVINGFTNLYFSNEIFVFDQDEHSMTRYTPSVYPSDRTFHSAVAVSEFEMMIWGGGPIVGFSFVPVADSDSMWIWDLETGEWTNLQQSGSLPQGRLGAAMARHGNNVFLFGGIIPKSDGSCCHFLNDMWKYSISQNTWTQISQSGTVPSPRGHAGFLVHGGALYLQGGEGGFDESDGSTTFTVEHGLWKYSINQNTWTLLDEENPDVNQRESQLFNHVGSKLICFGGDTPGPNFYNLVEDTQVFRLSAGEWVLQNTPVHPPKAKRMPSVSFEDGTVWLFGGNTDFSFDTFKEINHNEVWYWEFD